MTSTWKHWRWLLLGFVIGAGFFPAVILVTLVWIPSLEGQEQPAHLFEPDEERADEEAVLMLHTARQSVQDAYARTGEAPVKLTGNYEDGGCALDPELLQGNHYVLVNGVEVLEDGRMQVTVVPLVGDYALMRMPFAPAASNGEVILENHPKYEDFHGGEE